MAQNEQDMKWENSIWIRLECSEGKITIQD